MAQEAPSAASDNTVGRRCRWEKVGGTGQNVSQSHELGTPDALRLVQAWFFPLPVIQMEPASPEPTCFSRVQEMWALDHRILLSDLKIRSRVHLPAFDNSRLTQFFIPQSTDSFLALTHVICIYFHIVTQCCLF